ncbi:HBL/NHE enterotoxin family protein [Pseudoalteromonas sp. T1lg65]|uniref:HBL/NHE enterotoxin family protein n=1 Tax=Pseudoalteromonas sp. T1lg65 TaxID=2077101 RepID=UPI003F79A8F0
MRVPSIAPPHAQATKQNLANNLSALLHIRAYALSVQQIELFPISNPPPHWFNPLNQHISTAKGHADNWSNTIEPGIVSRIPNAINDFARRVDMIVHNIKQILLDDHNHVRIPSSDDVVTIKRDLEWLTHHATRDYLQIKTLHTGFQGFSSSSHQDYSALTESVDGIQSAIGADQRAIAHVKTEIANAKAEINADNLRIDASAIAGGAGLILGASLLGLGAAAGPAAPFLLLAGGFCMLGAAAESAGLISHYESCIRNLKNNINSLTSEMSHEEQQVVSLTLLKHHIDSVVDKNRAMGDSLSEISDWFEITLGKCSNALQSITDAVDDVSQVDWDDFVEDLEMAKSSWLDLKRFVDNMQIQATGSHAHTHRA